MAFQERAYAALVLSSSDKFNHSLLPLLTAVNCEPVKIAGNVSTAKRLIAEQRFDFIIINTPLPNELCTKLAIDVSSGEGTVCLVMTKADYYADLREKVLPHGVFTLSVPTSATAVSGGLEFLASARERLRYFEKKTVSIEDKMEEIRLVNRAKWLLIEHRGLTEPEAHRLIEKEAMDNRKPRREIAEDIINRFAG